MTVKTFEINGREFKMVNEPTPEAMVKIIEAIHCVDTGELKRFAEITEKIGSGACGTVFAVAEEYALKVNYTGYCSWEEDEGELNDGKILESLQGLPLVPTLYAYSKDEKYMIVKRIKGKTIDAMGYSSKDELDLSQFNYQTYSEDVKSFYKQAIERNWRPKDLHSENVMVDSQGKLWVIDFGLFEPTTQSEFKGRMQVLEHVDTLNYYATGKYPESEAGEYTDACDCSYCQKDFLTF